MKCAEDIKIGDTAYMFSNYNKGFAKYGKITKIYSPDNYRNVYEFELDNDRNKCFGMWPEDCYDEGDLEYIIVPSNEDEITTINKFLQLQIKLTKRSIVANIKELFDVD